MPTIEEIRRAGFDVGRSSKAMNGLFIGLDLARPGSDRTVMFYGGGRNFGKTASLDPALTARPVQGSHRFMPVTRDSRETPTADLNVGFSARVDRAIEELAAAVAAARKNGRGITGEQHTRILHIPDHA